MGVVAVKKEGGGLEVAELTAENLDGINWHTSSNS